MKAHERFLSDVVGVIARAEHAEHRARDCHLMALDQSTEGVVVTIAGASDQCGIIVAFCHVCGGE